MTSANTYLLGDAEITVPPLPSGLYVTATPIGNLGDITLRGLETLAGADLIACEDTRITSRLTQRYGIVTPLIAYHEHNAERQRPKIMEVVGSGQAVALVSDAGTPLVSDPGYRLVVEAIAAGYDVFPIPGASALLAGLVGAGLPTDRFMFAGFLPSKQAARRTRLEELADIAATIVFYEAPQRLSDTLADMADVLGEARSAALARELTKKFETFRRGSLEELAEAFACEPAPKGEITIIVGPPPPRLTDEADIDALLRSRMAEVSLSEAVADVTAATSSPRKLIYRRALALRTDVETKKD